MCLIRCITYYLIGCHGKNIEHGKNLTETFSILDKEDLGVQLLDDLFDWALGLKKEESSEEWPDHLPIPTINDYNAKVTYLIFRMQSAILCFMKLYTSSAVTGKAIKISMSNCEMALWIN